MRSLHEAHNELWPDVQNSYETMIPKFSTARRKVKNPARSPHADAETLMHACKYIQTRKAALSVTKRPKLLKRPLDSTLLWYWLTLWSWNLSLLTLKGTAVKCRNDTVSFPPVKFIADMPHATKSYCKTYYYGTGSYSFQIYTPFFRNALTMPSPATCSSEISAFLWKIFCAQKSYTMRGRTTSSRMTTTSWWHEHA